MQLRERWKKLPKDHPLKIIISSILFVILSSVGASICNGLSFLIGFVFFKDPILNWTAYFVIIVIVNLIKDFKGERKTPGEEFGYYDS